jgi:hypothetical protein
MEAPSDTVIDCSAAGESNVESTTGDGCFSTSADEMDTQDTDKIAAIAADRNKFMVLFLSSEQERY